MEEVLYRRDNKRFRPFSQQAEILNRGCSILLQRIVTDFGADIPFGQVPEKLKEHYGIEVATSVIARITERHARAFYQHPERVVAKEETGQGRAVIAEMDGSMVPVVISNPEQKDKRKGKTLQWNEVKLCLAHQQGSQRICFGGTFSGGVEQAGIALYQCAVAAGFNQENPLHAVGDGAVWITEQIEQQFGADGHYLIDFYHVCEYLAEAATHCATDGKAWLEEQKSLLKSNQYKRVLINLLPHIEPPQTEDKNAPVRRAHRYLGKRAAQLDYQGALEKGLPIGSGEIESAHRYIIQQRLKRAGSWWTPDNIDGMLALRLARANKRWKDYWAAVMKNSMAA